MDASYLRYARDVLTPTRTALPSDLSLSRGENFWLERVAPFLARDGFVGGLVALEHDAVGDLTAGAELQALARELDSLRPVMERLRLRVPEPAVLARALGDQAA